MFTYSIRKICLVEIDVFIMGLLDIGGAPMAFEEAKKHLQFVRQHGIIQFLHTWRRVKDLTVSDYLSTCIYMPPSRSY